MLELRIYVADDHPIIRATVRELIELEPDMIFVGEAADGETAVDDVGRLIPDVVVMDVSMPGIGGIEATRRISKAFPGVLVLALTTHEHPGYRRAMLEAGASGYVFKRSAPKDLIPAIRRAVDGEAFVSPDES